MTWTRLDPGAGDPGAIRAMADGRDAAASDVSNGALVPLKMQAENVADYWVGLAATAYYGAVSSNLTHLQVLAAQYSHDARALRTYATEVEQIKADAVTLRGREEDARLALSVMERQASTLRDDPAAAADLARLEARITTAQNDTSIDREWDRLAERRQAADQAAVGSLSGRASLGGFANGGGAAASLMTDKDLLAFLAGLSATELRQYLRENPSVLDRIAGMEDPAAIAEWWQSMGDADDPLTPSTLQMSLLTAYPAVFGNLNGVWYTHRDIANTLAFEADYERLAAIAEEYYSLMRIPDNSWDTDPSAAFIAKYGYTPQTFAEAWGDAKAIKATLDGEGAYPYQFIQYQPGHPSMAAIAVGNMDTATQITTNVPGMGTTVNTSLQEWTLTAENVYREQRYMNALYGSEAGMAVVAWIGYDAPEMATNPSLEVLSSDNARPGATNLVHFLEGISGTRGWDAGENLSVIGHSYGTTVASLALSQTPAENFVMLGSAGIDESIPTVADLQVDQANVWASEAAGDWVADLGRGNVFGLPLNAGPFSGIDAFDHSIDPTTPGYGANVFSSEDAVVNGVALPGSDWHTSTPQIYGELHDKPTDQYGYLDWGTNPLRNTALLSLGITDPSLVTK